MFVVRLLSRSGRRRRIPLLRSVAAMEKVVTERADVVGGDVSVDGCDAGVAIFLSSLGQEQRTVNHSDDNPNATRVAFRYAVQTHTTGEEVIDKTGELMESPMQSKKLGVKVATRDAKLKSTLRTMSLAPVRRGVNATGRGEGTLLAVMVVLHAKWPK